MEYAVEMADRIAEKLRSLPPTDASKTRLNKQGVVIHLAGEIAALQDRECTLLSRFRGSSKAPESLFATTFTIDRTAASASIETK